MNNDRIKQVPDKTTAFRLMATEICLDNIRHISKSFVEGLTRTKRDPIVCHADGFADGVAFALQGVAEGKINMKIIESEPPSPNCTVCWKPQSECDGGFNEMTE